ncbi:hypothetical protein [Streptomyces sp. NBC_01353]|uniref:hypothetical protein n=1 Tax=Streptomyces sp. NBC_01353 TaxID=2903835 RepID=UPI002E31C661|nr:hypothetical protein [Streptomyces sp. NBC_01353]
MDPTFADWVRQSFARGHWQQWPADQSAAVWEFLNAWWTHSLIESEPVFPAHELLKLCAEASATLGPWLEVWEALDHPVADRHLAQAASLWEYDLLVDDLPWETWHLENADSDAWRTELAAWLVRVAPARLHAHGSSEELLQRIRLIGLPGPTRWDDPHWPSHRY